MRILHNVKKLLNLERKVIVSHENEIYLLYTRDYPESDRLLILKDKKNNPVIILVNQVVESNGDFVLNSENGLYRLQYL